MFSSKVRHLEALGGTVITVWECELRGKGNAEARIQALADGISFAGELKKQKEERRKLSRAAAKREREQMLERQAAWAGRRLITEVLNSKKGLNRIR